MFTKSPEKTQKIEAKISPKNKISTPHGISTQEHLHLYHKAVFSWTAKQYIHYPKSRKWYFVAALIAIIVATGALVVGDWTFSLAIVVFGIVYYYIQEHHPPKNIHIVISEMGIKVGSTIYPFSHIQAFWFMYHPPFMKTLNLRLHKKFSHDVIIQMADENPVPIRQFLCGEIPEWEGKNERLTDIIVRLLQL